jgi:ribulose-5-phosphate 4-epimerase/fuculose-1-phosphate aldolase
MSSENSDLENVKHEVAVANRILAETGLASGALISLGHASMRLPSQPDTFVVKGRGYDLDALATMRPEDMLVCDLEGFRLDGPPGITQPNEVKIHSCIMRARPDVQAVVHVHPRLTVVMSVLARAMAPVCREGMPLVREPLPVYPHVALVTTDEEGAELAEVLGDRSAALLLGHGAVTVGGSLEEAVMNMVNLEEQAKMNWYAYCAAGPDYPRIPEELIAEEANKPRFDELPHFKDALQQAGPVKARGAWQYYTHQVSQDLQK